DWFAIAGVALVPGFVGHTLVIWSHRHVESWLSALITQCTPVITVTLAWVLLGETLPPLAIVGGAIVIVATGLVLVAAARRDDRESGGVGRLVPGSLSVFIPPGQFT